MEGVPKAIKKLPVVPENHAIHLEAIMDYEDEESGVRRQAGDQWQLKGPRTYIPVPEVVSVSCLVSCVCLNSKPFWFLQ